MVTGPGSSGRLGGDNLQTAVSKWPTPLVADAGEKVTIASKQEGLLLVASSWATPRVSMVKANGNPDRYGGRLGQGNIEDQVQRWSTPRASDGEKGGPNQSFGAGGVPLVAQATNWSTPSVADTTGGRKARSGDRAGEMLNNSLAPYVTNNVFPTPTAVNRPRTDETIGKSAAYRKAKAGQNTVPLYLEEVVQRCDLLGQETPLLGASSPPTARTFYQRYRATTDSALRCEMRALRRMARDRRPISIIKKDKAGGGEAVRPAGWTPGPASLWIRPAFRRQLNPRFVEWLMSWPPGLTSFDCSETALRMHKEAWRSELASMTSLPAAPPAQLSLFG